jgi:hypothetical protein
MSIQKRPKKQKPFDIRERLFVFACDIVDVAELRLIVSTIIRNNQRNDAKRPDRGDGGAAFVEVWDLGFGIWDL